MSERDDPSLLAPAAALGSLTDGEHAAYDAYLADDADARRDADAFDSVADALAYDRPEGAPPASLKARLMTQIALTPQLPPLPAGDPEVEPASGRHLAPQPPGATPSAAIVPPVPIPQLTQTTPDAAPTRAEDRARARWFARPSVILVAAAAAVALFVGGTAVGVAVGNGSGSSVSAQADAFAQISAAPDAQRTTAKVTGGGSATLVFSHDLGKSAVVVDGATPPPSHKAYQLWYIRDGKPTSAGMLPTSESSPWQVLDGRMKAGDTVGLTIEPAGGSKQPTTKPVVLIKS